MTDDLKERLKGHARAFDSLLSLIPAKLYYGEDVSDQWMRKKQTPEQKRAAKMAKLDPDNWKSAKDIMDERASTALKRKREEDEDLEDGMSDVPGIEPEKPRAAQELLHPKAKKPKGGPETDAVKPSDRTETESEAKRTKGEQRAAKKERKREKKAKARENSDGQKSRIPNDQTEQSFNTGKRKESTSDYGNKDEKEKPRAEPSSERTESETMINPSAVMSDIDSNTGDSQGDFDVFSPQHESGTSSISSIQTGPLEETSDAKPQPSMLKSQSNSADDGLTPKERLQAAISQFRAERKANGVSGREPKSRQELLEQRRRKEDERRAAKKEQRRKEKEEEARRQDEEIERRFSPGGSGSLLASPRSPIVDHGTANNFSFGRIAFEDGSHIDSSLSGLNESHKKKGPRDTASALQAAENKKSRLAGLDEEKRLEIEQKDMWLNAKKRAHGEKVKDDTSLLKKALKRQQGQKKKSERDWNNRIEGVQKSQEARQKKRTENIQKRKNEKASKGKSGKVKRPGFEGSFRGRTGGGKKK